jgi:hypothetical protein
MATREGSLSISCKGSVPGYFCFQTYEGGPSYCGVKNNTIFDSGKYAKLKLGYLKPGETVRVTYTPQAEGCPPQLAHIIMPQIAGSDLRGIDVVFVESEMVLPPLFGERENWEPLFYCHVSQKNTLQHSSKQKGTPIRTEYLSCAQPLRSCSHGGSQNLSEVRNLGRYVLEGSFRSSLSEAFTPRASTPTVRTITSVLPNKYTYT